jgi:hypothetical protein
MVIPPRMSLAFKSFRHQTIKDRVAFTARTGRQDYESLHLVNPTARQLVENIQSDSE